MRGRLAALWVRFTIWRAGVWQRRALAALCRRDVWRARASRAWRGRWFQ